MARIEPLTELPTNQAPDVGAERGVSMSFVVIENTPGYLPEDDDPATFEDETSAREYLKERVEGYCDFLAEGYDYDESYEPNVWWSPDLTAANVDDPRRIHDLGRVFYVDVVEES